MGATETMAREHEAREVHEANQRGRTAAVNEQTARSADEANASESGAPTTARRTRNGRQAKLVRAARHLEGTFRGRRAAPEVRGHGLQVRGRGCIGVPGLRLVVRVSPGYRFATSLLQLAPGPAGVVPLGHCRVAVLRRCTCVGERVGGARTCLCRPVPRQRWCRNIARVAQLGLASAGHVGCLVSGMCVGVVERGAQEV